MRKKYAVLISVLAVAFIFCYFASPFYALYSMRSAGIKGDSEAFSEYVDYPKVRESLKASFKAKMAAEMSNGDDSSLGMLGTVFAAKFMDAMVDALVTPEMLTMILEGKHNGKAGDDKKSAESAEKTSEDKGHGAKLSYSYSGFNKFVITSENPDEPDSQVKVIFYRNGLFGWKLTKLILF